MTEPLVVRISDLRYAVNRVLDATETVLGPEVALDADYYWHLPVDAAFDVYTEPQALTTGQLSDDLEVVPDLSDGVHPTSAGFQKMSNVWYAGIVPEPSAIGRASCRERV